MPDVVISYATLESLIEKLSGMITELDTGSKGSALRSAIGEPFGRSELTDRAEETEDRWNDKRESLVEDLTSIRDFSQEIHDGYAQFDDEAAAQFESGADVPGNADY
ncbi:hypothetical protein [Microbacterium sp. ZXX196]|uniref:hypothetical protein n=1 Tax=Microbacterium sp. ZXX196 TaxID=2609291 RepID=UPI0012B92795|nr:hypothetical protein [Microbacterium sp. ZXX196]MTE24457.1 hypothetical protein [Microbacterium sp. ZXX196]